MTVIGAEVNLEWNDTKLSISPKFPILPTFYLKKGAVPTKKPDNSFLKQKSVIQVSPTGKNLISSLRVSDSQKITEHPSLLISITFLRLSQEK